jgi:hypothetical protein
MSMTDDRPTVAERYAVAMESSNLRMRAERGGDVDVLAAAGMAKGRRGEDLTLALSLYRLRCEFDSVKAILQMGKALSAVDRLSVLTRLNTLSWVKQHLGAHAIIQATKQRFMKPDQDALRVAGRALDVWLSPLCQKCNGVGKQGGYGEPQVLCRPCGGTGHRKATIGEDDADRKFGQFMLADMDGLVAIAEDSVRRRLER